MTARRIIQLFCLGIFLLLLIGVVSPASWEALDFFLRLDPLLAAGTAISARALEWLFLPALIVLLSGFVVGRGFCGYICPMGTTLDGTDRLFGRRAGGNPTLFSAASGLARIKYAVLGFVMGAAALKVSFVFLAAPLSLITRLYGLVFYPVAALGIESVATKINLLNDILYNNILIFNYIDVPRYSTQLFVLSFFSLLFAAAHLAPRFWCRNLCPAGAMLAVCSRKPFIRRRVTARCTRCGVCARACPAGAIDPDDPAITDFPECIVCTTCSRVCPEQAVAFNTAGNADADRRQFCGITRRQFLTAGAAGAGTAAVSLTGLVSPLATIGEGQVQPPGLIRPPGARIEIDFLARCVRCAECMLACPTNTLQPIWLTAGFLGIFSPAVIPRRGYCDPHCHRCAEVCPTGAIRNISLSDRIWAKIGTAVIERQRCLAWEQQKSCMVCDEVCPYDAIDFRREAGNPVPVPHVAESRCAGCGFCEHYCPVRNRSAILVTPMGALRQNGGRYEDTGRLQGLSLRLRASASYGAGEGPGSGHGNGTLPELAPGFDSG